MGEEDRGLLQVAWLVSDALRTEEKAADLDRRSCAAEAALHHKRASSRLAEAASLCPEGHPDRAAIAGHAQDIATRAVYLQSLGGAQATMALEDHVGDIELTALELTADAPPPPGQDVATLVAATGVSGQTAPLTEEGCRLVLALKSAEELRVYVLRLLQKDWRRVKAGAEAEAQLDAFAAEFCGMPAARGESLDSLRHAMREAPWAELNLEPGQDRLQLGAAMEREARELEAGGQPGEALQAYARAVAVFQLVERFDPRSKNPKIKEMVGNRIVELKARIQALEGR